MVDTLGIINFCKFTERKSKTLILSKVIT